MRVAPGVPELGVTGTLRDAASRESHLPRVVTATQLTLRSAETSRCERNGVVARALTARKSLAAFAQHRHCDC